jgi:hypothetical protein
MPPAIDAVWIATRCVPNFGAVAFGDIGILQFWGLRPPAVS